ncbi:MAG: hypothetical protein ACPGWR_27765, partial [Ardenticatenaceae bacterium]
QAGMRVLPSEQAGMRVLPRMKRSGVYPESAKELLRREACSTSGCSGSTFCRMGERLVLREGKVFI